MKKAIGILGGMGPEATWDLFGKLIRHTDASCDAEHIRIYIDCHVGIPDRTRAILAGGESPVPAIVQSAKKLAMMGADFLLLPCNTSHYFYEELCRQSPLPIMDMIATAATALREQEVDCVGLLATDGTVQSGVYASRLEAEGIRLVLPDADGQREVMRLIYDGVKANAPTWDTAPVQRVLEQLRAAGAKRVVLGCTELPLAFERYGMATTDTVDATDELARAAVAAAGYRVK